MLVVSDKGGAIALMLAALCFLGTWPAVMVLVERRGRHLVHTYLDYSIPNYLVAVVIAFTLGQIGSSTPATPNFVEQLHQVSISLLTAIICTDVHKLTILSIFLSPTTSLDRTNPYWDSYLATQTTAEVYRPREADSYCQRF